MLPRQCLATHYFLSLPTGLRTLHIRFCSNVSNRDNGNTGDNENKENKENPANNTIQYVNGKPKQEDQGYLTEMVRRLFPGNKLVVNARAVSGIRSSSTHQLLEIDIFLPDLNLGFEYQEEHHYTSTFYSTAPLSEYQGRDSQKHAGMLYSKHDLIVIPCWWDRQQASLVGTIKHLRPDLLRFYEGDFAPIPHSPPEVIKAREIPLVGELALSVPYHVSHLSRGSEWWLSEKYDGVRACWNPVNRTLYSRGGAAFVVTASMLGKMPQGEKDFLDGELWFGREGYKFSATLPISSTLSSSVSSQQNPMEGIGYERLRFLVFDCPNSAYQSVSIEKRIEVVLSAIENNHPFVIPTFYSNHFGTKEIQDLADSIVLSGGEGVILREALSIYHHGRSNSFLKLKTQRDSDARIMEIGPNNTYLCQLGTGEVFEALLSRKFSDSLLPGDIVTFRYAMINKYKVPRHDIDWQYVVDSSSDEGLYEARGNTTVSDISKKASVHRPSGYWTRQDGINGREFLVQYAEQHNIDYKNPEEWYKVTKESIVSAGGASLLTHFGGSHRRAIASAFPDVAIFIDHWATSKVHSVSDDTTNKSTRTPSKYWDEAENCRQFFDLFASSKQFDPTLVSSWYSVTHQDIIEAGGKSILRYHGGSMMKALHRSYPSLVTQQTSHSRQQAHLDHLLQFYGVN